MPTTSQTTVPGVLYGGGEQKHFSVKSHPKLVVNPDVFRISLEMEGETFDCVIQEVQFHQ